MMKRLLCVCLVAMLSVSASAVVIGNWESDLDGWIDWNGNATLTAGQSVGVTLGSGSLLVDQSGWDQTLSIKLQDNDLVDAFMANSIFTIDVSVAANDGTIDGGYSQVAAVYMNAAGPGWTTVSDSNPINFYWWQGSGERTLTLEIDYSAFRDAITDTGYIEIILALNNGGGAPTEMYFDNAQLLVPEPATLSILGLGGLALLRRKV